MEMSSEFGKEHLQESITSRLRGLRPDEINADMLAAEPEISTANTTQTVKLETYIMAGAAAGIMEHCLMYPVDCVKVSLLSNFSREGREEIVFGSSEVYDAVDRCQMELETFSGHYYAINATRTL